VQAVAAGCKQWWWSAKLALGKVEYRYGFLISVARSFFKIHDLATDQGRLLKLVPNPVLNNQLHV
jgi:hypothetical protein